MAENGLTATVRKVVPQNADLKGFKGFTLAEVLITLVIIGVIAAMTIPTLMNNTNKQEYVSRLIKTYSTLNQGLNAIWNNNDTAPGDYTMFHTVNYLDEFEKVGSIQKKCNTIQACIGVSIATRYKTLKNSVFASLTDGKTVITSDGQLISYVIVTSSAAVYLSAENQEKTIGRFFVDVNGAKGPNKLGVDAYYLYLVEGKGVVPSGMDGVTYCNTNNHGQDCAAKVLKEKAITYI